MNVEPIPRQAPSDSDRAQILTRLREETARILDGSWNLTDLELRSDDDAPDRIAREDDPHLAEWLAERRLLAVSDEDVDAWRDEHGRAA